MKATTSTSLLSWVPAGFGSLPSGSSYFCDSWHLESGGKGGKGKKKKGRKEGEGSKDPKTAAIAYFLSHQAVPSDQHRIRQRE